MIVFDFDKTLTNKDTLFGFYRQADQSSPFFGVKRILFIFIGIASKFKLLNNYQLKVCGVKLFLQGKSKDLIEKAAVAYAKKIQLNNVFEEQYLCCLKNKRLIISASFEDYIKILLADEKILASQLEYKYGLVSGIKLNLFGKEKNVALLKDGVDKIDILYTDSYSDKPLMSISTKVYLVGNGKIKIIKDDAQG